MQRHTATLICGIVIAAVMPMLAATPLEIEAARTMEARVMRRAPELDAESIAAMEKRGLKVVKVRAGGGDRLPRNGGEADGDHARPDGARGGLRSRARGTRRLPGEGYEMSRRIGARAEDLIASAAVIALVVLPLAEIVVRQVLVTGIPGAGPFTQHLTLAVGMLGAAITARDGKLLAMATGTLLPDGRFRRFAQVFVNAVGGAVAAVFTMGGTRSSGSSGSLDPRLRPACRPGWLHACFRSASA